jgi:hypothetical protein
MMRLSQKAMLGLGALLLFSGNKRAKPAPGKNRIVIPKGGQQMNLDQLRDLARAVGFPPESVDIAGAVAMAESSGYVDAVGDNGQSFGLWQIHHPSHPSYEPSLLLTPSYNAQAALKISQGGANWEPWTTYRNGEYRKWLPAAAQALAPAPPVAGELEEPSAPPPVAAASVLEDDDTEVTASGTEPPAEQET